MAGPTRRTSSTTVTTQQLSSARTTVASAAMPAISTSRRRCASTAGVDYEWGAAAPARPRCRWASEKFFSGSPISVALVGQVVLEARRLRVRRQTSQRLVAMLATTSAAPRGGRRRNTGKAQVEVPGDPHPSRWPPRRWPRAAAPRVEKRWSRPPPPRPPTRSSILTRRSCGRTATSALDAVDRAASRPTVTKATSGSRGHTCDLGRDAHNQQAVRARAAAVRDLPRRRRHARDAHRRRRHGQERAAVSRTTPRAARRTAGSTSSS